MTGSGLPVLDAYVIVAGFSFILGIAFAFGVQGVVAAIHRRRP